MSVTLEAIAALSLLQRDFDEVAARVDGVEILAQHLQQGQASFADGLVDAAFRSLGKFRAAIAGSALGGKDAAALDRAGELSMDALRIPSIRIARAGPDQVQVSWTGPTGTSLQTSAKFGPTAQWFDVSTEAGRAAVELPASGTRAFFRLQLP